MADDDPYRRVLAAASEVAADFLARLSRRPAGSPSVDHEELLRAFDVPLRAEAEDPATVIRDLAAAADPGLVASAGPRYFGFVIGGSQPVAVAADWLTAVWDQNAGGFAVSPAASLVEEVAAKWILDLLGLPAPASVGFVTGCQMANYTCLAAARHAVLARAGWDVEQRGLRESPEINIVLGAEAHITILAALRFLGLGAGTARIAESDEQGRIRPESLRQVLAPLSGPAIVCLQAGNVNTGAVDPLEESIPIAHAKGAWVHLDGAFGLWAAAAPSLRHLVRGAEKADSWATDAHKWLNVPYDCGIAIVRDAESHRASMTSSAAYLQQSAGVERDPFDWTPEFSRRARGFPVYATLRALGRSGLAELVQRCCDQAKLMASLLAQSEGVDVLNEVVLNQVLVRFRAPGRDPDEVTRAVIARVQREGTCWLGGTTWHGMAGMRISFSNWSTTDEDVALSARAILQAFRDEAAR